MKKLISCLFLCGILTLTVLFFAGCKVDDPIGDAIKEEASQTSATVATEAVQPTASVTNTSITQTTATESLPPKANDPGIFETWNPLIWGAIGLVLGAAIMFGVLYFLSIRNSDGGSGEELRRWRDEANYSAKRLKEYEKMREKYARYESMDAQIPAKKQQYVGKWIEIDAAFPKMIETDFPDLSKEPSEYSGPYDERIRALDSIFKYFTRKTQKAQTLKQECLDSLRAIETEEPDIAATLKTVINTASEDGLTALKPVLSTFQKRAEKHMVSDQLKAELAALGKSVEGIRDYSFRLVPSRLLKFATELIGQPVSDKENQLREKVVREVIALINQYLKL